MLVLRMYLDCDNTHSVADLTTLRQIFQMQLKFCKVSEFCDSPNFLSVKFLSSQDCN